MVTSVRLEENTYHILSQTNSSDSETSTSQSGLSDPNPSPYIVIDYPLDHTTVKFILDSGAEAHMCNSRTAFSDIKPCHQIPFIYVANGQKVPCEGIGTLDLQLHTGSRIRI